MNNNTYTFFNDIFFNFNITPCQHYNLKYIIPLKLSCKKLNEIYTLSPYNNVHKCDICYFRDIKCTYCIKTTNTSCDKCICKICNVSANLTGNFPIINSTCNKCLVDYPSGETGPDGPTGCPSGEHGPRGCLGYELNKRQSQRAQKKIYRKKYQSKSNVNIPKNKMR